MKISWGKPTKLRVKPVLESYRPRSISQEFVQDLQVAKTTSGRPSESTTALQKSPVLNVLDCAPLIFIISSHEDPQSFRWPVRAGTVAKHVQ
jgi:hypothetical protein